MARVHTTQRKDGTMTTLNLPEWNDWLYWTKASYYHDMRCYSGIYRSRDIDPGTGYPKEGATPTQPTLLGYVVASLGEYIRMYVASVYCHFRGHDMVDAGSYAGPDSAEEVMECRRCRLYWSHTYY